MNRKPPLIVVSYYFAPNPLVGAKRFSFLTREFTRLGFDVHVITSPVRESPYGFEDPSLPLHGTVHRVRADFEPRVTPFEAEKARKKLGSRLETALFRRLLAPVGAEYFWARAATRKALEIAQSLPPGVIIATSPPPAALIAGARIARKLGWPLVLDYRDPWSAYEWPSRHRGALARWVATWIESRLVRRSAARVLNTPDMREWFEEAFDFARSDRNFVVPNGFDPVPPAAGPDPNGPLQIVHAGEIYGSRTLVPLMRAMQRLAASHPGRPIRLTNYGPLPPSEWQRIRSAGLDGFIEERPRVPLAELFPELQRAHVLLALVSDHMGYSTPYKVYDYMAAGRPILGLAPRDAALHELLAESGAGESADPRDIDAIEIALNRCLFEPPATRDSRIENFRWSRLAEQYRAVLELVQGPGEDIVADQSTASAAHTEAKRLSG